MSATKYNFNNRVALITGSSSGIGAAIAIQLSRYGAKVTITGRNADALAAVATKVEQASPTGAKPLQIVGDLVADKSLPQRLIDETVAKFGRLDVLVNNAGGTVPSGKLADETFLEDFHQVFKLNLYVPVVLIRLATEHLAKTKGNIINMSSVAGIKPWSVAYSGAKAALDMVTKTTALELAPKGIRVNSINPGPIITGFGRSMGMDDKTYNGFVGAITKVSPLGFIGEADDVANLASFLASDDARNITGSIHVTDSGFLNYTPQPPTASK